MVEVPNADSVAAMRALSALLGRKVGPSTGTNLVAMLAIAHEMRKAGRQGSILSLLCDAGERYLPSYHDADWVREAFGDISAAERRIEALLQ
jgi:cysteine synthase A